MQLQISTAYSGQQQNWPTQPGEFVTNNCVIPAYIHSWPNGPYIVIGYLDATTAPIRRRGVVSFAARRAKDLGADAIIVMQQGQEYAGAIGNSSALTSGKFTTLREMAVHLFERGDLQAAEDLNWIAGHKERGELPELLGSEVRHE